MLLLPSEGYLFGTVRKSYKLQLLCHLAQYLTLSCDFVGLSIDHLYLLIIRFFSFTYLYEIR